MRISQPDLFGDVSESALQRRLIRRRADFDALFKGFSSLKAVTYVASPRTLVELHTKFDFSKIELVLGLDFGQTYRSALQRDRDGTLEQLLDLVDAEALQVYVPTGSRSIHTKLYIAYNDDTARVIQTSANLTETAKSGRNQTNYAWYLDLPVDSPELKELEQDYKEHVEGCVAFLGDLIELFNTRDDLTKPEAISIWLQDHIRSPENEPEKEILVDLGNWAMEPSSADTEEVFRVQLSDRPQQKERIEKTLLQFRPQATSETLIVDRTQYLNTVQRNTGVPKLSVDLEHSRLILGIEGEIERVDHPLARPEEVDAALALLERYINLVDRGASADHMYVKTAMFEALLYMFSAPFANLQMKAMRERRRNIVRRGPKFLYLVGQSGNGKTMFLTHMLFLLTGRHIEPLSPSDFNKTRLDNARSLGTCFPLVFDDITPSQKREAFETAVKFHWERDWSPDSVFPQLVFSSNYTNISEWTKSRVNLIEFDVHFTSSEQNSAALSEVMSHKNPIFYWFSNVFLDKTNRLYELRDDELYPARAAMHDLYEYAGRIIPSFFSEKPLDQIPEYNPGRIKWRELALIRRQVQWRYQDQRLIAEFHEDLQHWEITRLLGLLPQWVKSEHVGRKLVIDNPEEFAAWIGEGILPARSLLKRTLEHVISGHR